MYYHLLGISLFRIVALASLFWFLLLLKAMICMKAIHFTSKLGALESGICGLERTEEGKKDEFKICLNCNRFSLYRALWICNFFTLVACEIWNLLRV
jgi:hypothetical protein